MTWFAQLPLGRHAPGDSRIHRLDPRAKLLAAVLLLAGSLLGGSGAGLWACLPLLLYALWASGVGVGYFIRGFTPLWGVLLFSALLHAVTTPGRPLWPTPLYGVSWTREGWALGLTVAGQLAAAMGAASLLTLTTAPEALVAGLGRLFAPLARLGLPVEEFCHSILVALRLLPALGREIDAMLSERPRVATPEIVLRRLLRDARELREASASAAMPALGPWGAGEWAALGLAAASPAAAFFVSRGVGA